MAPSPTRSPERRRGLCSSVGRVFRRLLCLQGSRRGSSESRYQQLETGSIVNPLAENVLPSEEDELEEEEEEIEQIKEREEVIQEGEEEQKEVEGDEEDDTDSEEDSIELCRRVVKPRIESPKRPAFFPISPSQSIDSLTEDMITFVIRRRVMENEAKNGPGLKRKKKNSNRRCYTLSTRFLTIRKRRRRKLVTRNLERNVAPALLDDTNHGQIKCYLTKADNWPFNAFNMHTASGGQTLPIFCLHLFNFYGLIDHFNLEAVNVWKLFNLIEEGYHSTNPYHNAVHAIDVTQAMHCFLQEHKIRESLTPTEVLSALIAAVAHDLDHPGVNQPFLVATSSHLATIYQLDESQRCSILENHHWRSTVGCLEQSGIAEQLRSLMPDLSRRISSLILATDITRQSEFLHRFRSLNPSQLSMESEEDRHFVLQIALKCADISNPCRPWDVSKMWSEKVCEEFFRQGNFEAKLGLPLTMLCDKSTSSIPKIQTGFFKFIVMPLFEEWHRFLNTTLTHTLMEHLKHNQQQWETLLEKELAEEERAARKEEAARILERLLDTRRSSLPAPLIPEVAPTVVRRHSVPLVGAKAITETRRGEGLKDAIITKSSTDNRSADITEIDSDDIMDEEDEEKRRLILMDRIVAERLSKELNEVKVRKPDEPCSSRSLMMEDMVARSKERQIFSQKMRIKQQWETSVKPKQKDVLIENIEEILANGSGSSADKNAEYDVNSSEEEDFVMEMYDASYLSSYSSASSSYFGSNMSVNMLGGISECECSLQEGSVSTVTKLSGTSESSSTSSKVSSRKVLLRQQTFPPYPASQSIPSDGDSGLCDKEVASHTTAMPSAHRHRHSISGAITEEVTECPEAEEIAKLAANLSLLNKVLNESQGYVPISHEKLLTNEERENALNLRRGSAPDERCASPLPEGFHKDEPRSSLPYEMLIKSFQCISVNPKSGSATKQFFEEESEHYAQYFSTDYLQRRKSEQPTTSSEHQETEFPRRASLPPKTTTVTGADAEE